MADYGKTRAGADKSLRKAGMLVTLRQTVTGAYDPVTGTETQTVTDYSAWGVKFDYSQLSGRQSMPSGSVVQPGDKQLLLSALQDNGQPLPALLSTDKIIAGGVTYAIANPGTIAPTDLVIMYDLQVRPA